MANSASKKGGAGGDMTLESRHLIGIFFGLVVICGVFFTLGYVMGRTQFDTTVNAAGIGKPAATAASAPRLEEVPAAAKPQSAVPSASEWSFPSATDATKPADRLEPPPPKPVKSTEQMKVELNRAQGTPAPAQHAPLAAASSRALGKAPVIPRGASVLQVAALSKESDALALADALQRKNFSAFVLRPLGDNLYRVQVGPYANAAAAEAGKKALLQQGFKAILKK